MTDYSLKAEAIEPSARMLRTAPGPLRYANARRPGLLQPRSTMDRIHPGLSLRFDETWGSRHLHGNSAVIGGQRSGSQGGPGRAVLVVERPKVS